MLDLLKAETEPIDFRFLEPECGSGNFLTRILQRKLAAVELEFGSQNPVILYPSLPPYIAGHHGCTPSARSQSAPQA